MNNLKRPISDTEAPPTRQKIRILATKTPPRRRYEESSPPLPDFSREELPRIPQNTKMQWKRGAENHVATKGGNPLLRLEYDRCFVDIEFKGHIWAKVRHLFRLLSYFLTYPKAMHALQG
jgi:hypothetical protein